MTDQPRTVSLSDWGNRLEGLIEAIEEDGYEVKLTKNYRLVISMDDKLWHVARYF